MPPKVAKHTLKRKRRKATSARLDAFTRGMIWGMHLAKLPREQICTLVRKKDGTAPQMNAVDKVIQRKAADPDWRGEESSAGGRPSSIDDGKKRKKRKKRSHSGPP